MSSASMKSFFVTRIAFAFGLVGLLGLQGCAISNFGYSLGFSTVKMDRNADPSKDFNRYAAGRWLDAARLPRDNVRISSSAFLADKVSRQLHSIDEEASQKSAEAVKGSPLQQVGDFYASGMDEKRLSALGVAPLQPLFDSIAASDSRKSLAETLARLELATNEAVLIGAGVATDLKDRKRNVIYVGDAQLAMGIDNYLQPEAQAIRDAYKKLVVDFFMLAGSQTAEAQTAANTIVTMETRIAARKLSPVQKQDPNKVFVTMSFADLKSLLSNIDLETYFSALGLPLDAQINVAEIEALRERNLMLSEYPANDTQTYLRWELLRKTSAYLSPAFIKPAMAFTQAMYGKIDTQPREFRVTGAVHDMLGHPLSQLYVEQYFPAEAKRAIEDLVKRIKAEFRRRLVEHSWLSAPTRRQALEKLDKLQITVGYPENWIDSSSVDIQRDDYLGNLFRLNTFSARRELAELGKAVTHDQFATSGSLPIDVNAGYSPSRNAIEIPAAFLQTPFYDVKADAAVNFCTMGAVIGHELTHGFDSQGRLFDAEGNVRDWWTKADAQNFLVETEKLVKQANAFEAAPGVQLNGQLAVDENLADIGGITLGYNALKTYLRDHPKENRKIGGFSPEQRCFLSWAQLWADKAREGWLKQVLAVDPHPPGVYRMAAPSRHVRGFYEAFGIKPGDPMWLDEADRVNIW